MKHKATMLFAVAIAGGPAAADPVSDPIRVLASGAPACGNVMFKSYNQTPCPTLAPALRVILTLVREGQRIQRDLPFLRELDSPSLTLALADRLGS